MYVLFYICNMELEKLTEKQISERTKHCPECEKTFVASNLQRKFCCQQCHDLFHNRKNRLQGEEKKKEFAAEAHAIEQQSLSMRVANNVAILEGLKVGFWGLVIQSAELTKMGFDAHAYDGRYPTKNEKSLAVDCGRFTLIWWKEHYIKIQITK